MRRTFASLSLVLLAATVLAACSSSSGSADGSPDAKPTPGPNDPKKDPAKDPANDPTTQIVVAIDAENFQSIGMIIGQLEIITRIDGVATTELVDPATGPLFPRELRIYAPKDRTDAAVEIEVIAHDRIDSMNPPELQRVARTKFVKGTTKLAYVFLEIRCNHGSAIGGGNVPYGPTCDAPTTCIGGACVSADLPALGDYYADWATNPPSACGSGTPELTIGQGEKAMAPLADGATVTLDEGIQCGHHFWLSLSMKNLAQQGTITTLSATQPGTGISAAGTAYPYRWNAESGGTCDLVGLRFQLDAGGQKIADFLGKPLDVTVEAKDKAGHTATAVRHITIDPVMNVIPGRNCAGAPDGG